MNTKLYDIFKNSVNGSNSNAFVGTLGALRTYKNKNIKTSELIEVIDKLYKEWDIEIDKYTLPEENY